MDPEFQTVYLSLGSNLGDRKSNLDRGMSLLDSTGVRIVRASSFFETEPVGYRDQPWFLNLAVEAMTALSPADLLENCKKIEMSCGRLRPFPGGPRTLDLDILLYEDMILSSSGLTIPHPRMIDRRFVLEPLAEIAPEMIHPVLQRTVGFLLKSCPDRSLVHLYPPEKSPDGSTRCD